MLKCIKQTSHTTGGNMTGFGGQYVPDYPMWPRISRYCKEGYFNIDNNGVENSIRPITLGRKNYLFSGNVSGAEDNCIFYTLLGSCLQAGIEPHKWLTKSSNKLGEINTIITTLTKIKNGLSIGLLMIVSFFVPSNTADLGCLRKTAHIMK